MNSKIINTFNTMVKDDGLHDTYLDEVKFFKSSHNTSRQPLIYDFCLLIAFQGKKIGYLNDLTFQYSADTYLVVPTALPFECETIASEEEPFLCIGIEMNRNTMYELINSISNPPKIDKDKHLGVFSDEVNKDIEDSVYRLMNALKSKEESEILGKSILKELFYRIIQSPNASFLYKLFLNSNVESKIVRSLKIIHNNYSQHISIPELARQEDMSNSSFHTHFKKVTNYSPLQYIKNIRLNKARDLIANEQLSVNDASFKVGYESVSQFSRDFKKFFGISPKDAKPVYDYIA